jgi:hypothetical protein
VTAVTRYTAGGVAIARDLVDRLPPAIDHVVAREGIGHVVCFGGRCDPWAIIKAPLSLVSLRFV